MTGAANGNGQQQQHSSASQQQAQQQKKRKKDLKPIITTGDQKSSSDPNAAGAPGYVASCLDLFIPFVACARARSCLLSNGCTGRPTMPKRCYCCTCHCCYTPPLLSPSLSLSLVTYPLLLTLLI